MSEPTHDELLQRAVDAEKLALAAQAENTRLKVRLEELTIDWHRVWEATKINVNQYNLDPEDTDTVTAHTVFLEAALKDNRTMCRTLSHAVKRVNRYEQENRDLKKELAKLQPKPQPKPIVPCPPPPEWGSCKSGEDARNHHNAGFKVRKAGSVAYLQKGRLHHPNGTKPEWEIQAIRDLLQAMPDEKWEWAIP